MWQAVLVADGLELIREVKFKFKATDGLCYYKKKSINILKALPMLAIKSQVKTLLDLCNKLQFFQLPGAQPISQLCL